MVRPTRERLLRWVGFAALGLCTFAVGVQLAFPYARLQERLVAALSRDHDVSVDRLSRGWLPGRFTMHGVRIATRAGEPFTLAFERVDADVGIRALLGDEIDLAFDATGANGRIRGRARESTDRVVLDLRATDVPLAFLSGAPIAGEPELRVHLTLPGGELSTARGDVDVACEDCALESPRIRLGRIDGHIAVEDGVACIAELRARSDDGELSLEGDLRLGRDLASIRANLVARFAPSDAFRRASPANRDFEAATATARRPDGQVVYAASGALGALRWQPAATADRKICPAPPAAPTVTADSQPLAGAALRPRRLALAPRSPDPPPEPEASPDPEPSDAEPAPDAGAPPLTLEY